RFYQRLLRDGTLAVGETYMDGWWDTPALDQMMERVCRANVRAHVQDSWVMLAQVIKARLLNRQSLTRAGESASRHYDIGNDLYEAMLDKRMLYTCAYWKDAKNLEEAQEAKLDLVCKKIGLRR